MAHPAMQATPVRHPEAPVSEKKNAADPEMSAIRRILNTLNGLDPHARRRVINYVVERAVPFPENFALPERAKTDDKTQAA